ncbi:MAG: (Fe-S)-binding protein [Candidatus Omnitrophota bacterium]
MTSDLNKEIEEIAAVCSDCGNCLFSCPVYNARLMEPDSPRGKVNLIKSLMDGRLKPSPLNKELVYRCMCCGSCEHSCTKGVEFVNMMVQYRNEASKGTRIPWLKKIILYLYQSLIFRKFIWVADLMAKTPLQKKLGIPRRRKAGIKHLLSGKPKKNDRTEYDILFFPGCVMSMFYPEIIVNIVELLKSKGFTVVIPRGLKCCGFPFVSQGWGNKFLRLRKKNQALFSQYQFRYLLAPCGTGAMTFKKYYDWGESLPQIYELTQFFYNHIPDMPVNTAPFKDDDRKITWHDPCHQLKSLRVEKQPRYFMTQLGEKFVDDKSALCCGFGGIFSVGFPSTSKKVLTRKQDRLNEIGAEVVFTSCPGCYLQLREHLSPEKDVRFFTDLFTKAK